MTYSGYLSPWLRFIVVSYQNGITPADIAHSLTPVVAKYYGDRSGYPAYVQATNIAYVLKRLGHFVPPSLPGSHERQDEAWRLRHDEQLKYRDIGARLGVTGGRAQQMVQRAERRRERQTELARRTEAREANQPPPEPVNRDPFAHWPHNDLAVDRQIVALHRQGVAVDLIRTQLNLKTWGEEQGWPGDYSSWHHERIREVIRTWQLRVYAIAWELGWLIPAPPPPPPLGRPLDMGGPRDEWIERGPWDTL